MNPTMNMHDKFVLYKRTVIHLNNNLKKIYRKMNTIKSIKNKIIKNKFKFQQIIQNNDNFVSRNKIFDNKFHELLKEYSSSKYFKHSFSIKIKIDVVEFLNTLHDLLNTPEIIECCSFTSKSNGPKRFREAYLEVDEKNTFRIFFFYDTEDKVHRFDIVYKYTDEYQKETEHGDGSLTYMFSAIFKENGDSIDLRISDSIKISMAGSYYVNMFMNFILGNHKKRLYHVALLYIIEIYSYIIKYKVIILDNKISKLDNIENINNCILRDYMLKIRVISDKMDGIIKQFNCI